MYRDAELGFFGAGIFSAFLVVSQTSSEQLRAISYRDRSFLFVVIAHKTEVYFRSWLAAGNISNQFVAILYALAVNCGDRVADFETCLISRTARDHVGNSYAAIDAIDTRNRRVFLGGEHDANRTTRYPMVRVKYDCVVNIANCG